MAVVFALMAAVGLSGCQDESAPRTGDPDSELSSIESTLNGIEADLDEP
ncbi:hypothetical protein ACFFQW_08430 [Umezawaea endophytica]|uniref:Uncharacterized protein n=1 Tax=Umezawaea endophytica TaxID=1654476 RepID=A0A9X3ADS6_9PSEU|nr:hypothetical protein [Umezawaea endophytica]MCS7476011.1 hypothetical protein [Umezawaea endophytica]